MTETRQTILRAFREDGSEVHPGDIITSFRSDKARFAAATRAPDGHRTGKVAFNQDGRPPARPGFEPECYMTVFDLEVRAVAVAYEDLPADGPWQQYVPALRDAVPFTTDGELRGVRTEPDGSTPTGDLAAEHITSAMLATYVIYRGQTPIAWHLPPGYPDHGSPARWVFPAFRPPRQEQRAFAAAVAAIPGSLRGAEN